MDPHVRVYIKSFFLCDETYISFTGGLLGIGWSVNNIIADASRDFPQWGFLCYSGLLLSFQTQENM